jgi:FtsH-binding integral membrane protein
MTISGSPNNKPEPARNGLRVFGVPIVIGVLSLAGLLAALLLGDAGRYFAWVALGLPLAIIVWAFFR